MKIFFQPHADIATAIAQVTAISQTQLRQLPQGTTPPLIITYNASTVPILQLAMSGRGISEQQLYDLGANFIRPQLVTVPGTAIPNLYGGKQREVQVDLNTQALQAKGLGPADVVNTIGESESDSAGRHVENRDARIQRRAERESEDRGGAEQPANQVGERRDYLYA